MTEIRSDSDHTTISSGTTNRRWNHLSLTPSAWLEMEMDEAVVMERIWLDICSFCSTNELLTLRQVSRPWSNFLKHSADAWMHTSYDMRVLNQDAWEKEAGTSLNGGTMGATLDVISPADINHIDPLAASLLSLAVAAHPTTHPDGDRPLVRASDAVASVAPADEPPSSLMRPTTNATFDFLSNRVPFIRTLQISSSRALHTPPTPPDLTPPVTSPRQVLEDAYDVSRWIDLQGQGLLNDYARMVGPTDEHPFRWLSVAIAGSQNPHTEPDVFILNSKKQVVRGPKFSSLGIGLVKPSTNAIPEADLNNLIYFQHLTHVVLSNANCFTSVNKLFQQLHFLPQLCVLEIHDPLILDDVSIYLIGCLRLKSLIMTGSVRIVGLLNTTELARTSLQHLRFYSPHDKQVMSTGPNFWNGFVKLEELQIVAESFDIHTLHLPPAIRILSLRPPTQLIRHRYTQITPFILKSLELRPVAQQLEYLTMEAHSFPHQIFSTIFKCCPALLGLELTHLTDDKDRGELEQSTANDDLSPITQSEWIQWTLIAHSQRSSNQRSSSAISSHRSSSINLLNFLTTPIHEVNFYQSMTARNDCRISFEELRLTQQSSDADDDRSNHAANWRSCLGEESPAFDVPYKIHILGEQLLFLKLCSGRSSNYDQSFHQLFHSFPNLIHAQLGDQQRSVDTSPTHTFSIPKGLNPLLHRSILTLFTKPVNHEDNTQSCIVSLPLHPTNSSLLLQPSQSSPYVNFTLGHLTWRLSYSVNHESTSIATPNTTTTTNRQQNPDEELSSVTVCLRVHSPFATEPLSSSLTTIVPIHQYSCRFELISPSTDASSSISPTRCGSSGDGHEHDVVVGTFTQKEWNQCINHSNQIRVTIEPPPSSLQQQAPIAPSTSTALSLQKRIRYLNVLSSTTSTRLELVRELKLYQGLTLSEGERSDPLSTLHGPPIISHHYHRSTFFGFNHLLGDLISLLGTFLLVPELLRLRHLSHHWSDSSRRPLAWSNSRFSGNYQRWPTTESMNECLNHIISIMPHIRTLDLPALKDWLQQRHYQRFQAFKYLVSIRLFVNDCDMVSIVDLLHHFSQLRTLEFSVDPDLAQLGWLPKWSSDFPSFIGSSSISRLIFGDRTYVSDTPIWVELSGTPFVHHHLKILELTIHDYTMASLLTDLFQPTVLKQFLVLEELVLTMFWVDPVQLDAMCRAITYLPILTILVLHSTESIQRVTRVDLIEALLSQSQFSRRLQYLSLKSININRISLSRLMTECTSLLGVELELEPLDQKRQRWMEEEEGKEVQSYRWQPMSHYEWMWFQQRMTSQNHLSHHVAAVASAVADEEEQASQAVETHSSREGGILMESAASDERRMDPQQQSQPQFNDWFTPFEPTYHPQLSDLSPRPFVSNGDYRYQSITAQAEYESLGFEEIRLSGEFKSQLVPSQKRLNEIMTSDEIHLWTLLAAPPAFRRRLIYLNLDGSRYTDLTRPHSSSSPLNQLQLASRYPSLISLQLNESILGESEIRYAHTHQSFAWLRTDSPIQPLMHSNTTNRGAINTTPVSSDGIHRQPSLHDVTAPAASHRPISSAAASSSASYDRLSRTESQSYSDWLKQLKQWHGAALRTSGVWL